MYRGTEFFNPAFLSVLFVQFYEREKAQKLT